MNATTANYLPAEMKASDADRDAVVSDLSEHFQAGRLDVEEFNERSSQALTARTWGELRKLLADLPAARPAAATSEGAGPRHVAFGWPAGLGGLVIAAVVLAAVFHAGWGLIWLVLFVLFMARRRFYRPSSAEGR